MPIEFLNYQFRARPNMDEPVLLIWDDFSGHWSKDVLIFARCINVEIMRVHPGYTYVCQPADVSWNKPLKDVMQAKWVAFLQDQVRSIGIRQLGNSSLKIAAPSRKDMVNWVTAASDMLSQQTIKSCFSRANLVAYPAVANVEGECIRAQPVPGLDSLILGMAEQDFDVMTPIDPARDIERTTMMANSEEEEEGAHGYILIV